MDYVPDTVLGAGNVEINSSPFQVQASKGDGQRNKKSHNSELVSLHKK